MQDAVIRGGATSLHATTRSVCRSAEHMTHVYPRKLFTYLVLTT